MKSINTIFVSDLDGTLLNSQKLIPPESVKILGPRIAQGLPFTFATARSAATVGEFCEALSLTLPVVVMNGVFIYDWRENRYLHKNPIPHDAVVRVTTLLSKLGIEPFFYSLEEDRHLCVEYTSLSNEEMRRFYEARKTAAYKRFEACERFEPVPEKCMVYVTMIDREEVLRPVYEWVRSDPGLSASLYRDNYSDCWYLEIYAGNADKMTGVQWLKEYTGAQRVVAFGDNYNDMAMLSSADESYVVKEAPEDVRRLATGTIGSHNENAVARFIKQYTEDQDEVVKQYGKGIDRSHQTGRADCGPG